MLYYTSRILCKQTNILRQKNFLTSSFFKFLSVLGTSRLLSKISLKRKNTVGDNENKYFHTTVKIISRFLLFQDRIWGRKARPKSHLPPPDPPTPFPFPPTVRVTPLFLAGTKSIFWHYRSRRRLVQRGEDPHSWGNKDCVGRVRRWRHSEGVEGVFRAEVKDLFRSVSSPSTC